MELVQILYVSHAPPGLDVAALRHILASSVRRNEADGLTGFLMHGHGLVRIHGVAKPLRARGGARSAGHGETDAHTENWLADWLVSR